MKLRKLPRQQLKERANQHIESMQLNDMLEPLDLLGWLADNMNVISDKLTGLQSRELERTSSSWYANVKVLNDKPKIVFETTWLYVSNATGAPPNLSFIDSFLTGISIEGNNDNPYELYADVTVDAAQWSNLVPHIVHYKTEFGLSGGLVLSNVRTEALNEAIALGKYFYPGLNKNMLKIGYDLGMLETVDTFKAWLPIFKADDSIEGILPNDMA